MVSCRMINGLVQVCAPEVTERPELIDHAIRLVTGAEHDEEGGTRF